MNDRVNPGGASYGSPPERSYDPPGVNWRPSVDEVAELLRARTKDSLGDEVGTFNENTRPTAEQVEAHITAALALVTTRLPATIPEHFDAAVTTLVAYRAALRIEKSYFPEQVATGRSAYEQLRQEYLDDLATLTNAVAQGGTAGTPGDRAWSEPTPTFLSVAGAGGDHWPEPENPENWAQPLQPPREPPLPEDLPVGDLPASGREPPWR